jgi:hypothetical protein
MTYLIVMDTARGATTEGMEMADYGRKGGTSATAGKRAETIVDRCGTRKRVFHGQRWLLVQQRDEADKPIIRAYHSEEDATERMIRDRERFKFMVEYVSPATPA